MLQFKFKIAHITCLVITAALFSPDWNSKSEKIPLKIREGIQTTPFEVTTSSSDVADEEQFSFTQADYNDESEGETNEWTEQPRQIARQRVENEEPSSLKTSVKEFTKIDANTRSYSMNGIKSNARIRVEQNVRLMFKKMKMKITGQPQDEVLMMTD